MNTYIRAVVAAKAIAEKYGIPLGDEEKRLIDANALANRI